MKIGYNLKKLKVTYRQNVGEKTNRRALHKISYGLYVVTSGREIIVTVRLLIRYSKPHARCARAEQEHSGTLPQILKLHPNAMVVATLKCKNLRARLDLKSAGSLVGRLQKDLFPKSTTSL